MISALKKLSKNLPDPVARHLKYIIDSMRNTPVDRAFVTVLETLTRAWADRQRVKLWYGKPGGASISVREFAVYFIEPAANGGLFAVGYDYLSQQVAAIRLQWVRRVQVLSGTYEIPARLERQRYLAGAWGIVRNSVDAQPIKVVLAFAPDVASLVTEKLAHTVHAMRITDKNRCFVSLQVSDLQEIIPWIRSWGAKVEVLEPKALRDEIAAETMKLAAVYGGGSKVTSQV